MVTLRLDAKFFLCGERYCFIFVRKSVNFKNLLTSFYIIWSLRPTLWSIDTLFQWIVLTFGPDSWEILLISSKMVSFATF